MDEMFEGLKISILTSILISILIEVALVGLCVLVKLEQLNEKVRPLQVTKCEVIGSRG